MLTEILFSKDVFSKGKTLHAIILPENKNDTEINEHKYVT